MARITYTNKTTAATSPLPATQKLTSGDANEIKASVNAAYDQIEEVAGEVAALVSVQPRSVLLQFTSTGVINESNAIGFDGVVFNVYHPDDGKYNIESVPGVFTAGKTSIAPIASESGGLRSISYDTSAPDFIHLFVRDAADVFADTGMQIKITVDR